MTQSTLHVTPAIQYKVVVNHEEQYSLWIDGRDNAPGWWDSGCRGSKEECLDFVRRQWTDMRPLSLRRASQQEPAPCPLRSTRTEEGLALIG